MSAFLAPIRDTVNEWIERSACNAKGTDSILHPYGHCVRTLSQFFAHSCSAPSMFCRMVTRALLNFGRREIYQVQLYCIVHHFRLDQNGNALLLGPYQPQYLKPVCMFFYLKIHSVVIMKFTGCLLLHIL